MIDLKNAKFLNLKNRFIQLSLVAAIDRGKPFYTNQIIGKRKGNLEIWNVFILLSCVLLENAENLRALS